MFQFVTPSSRGIASSNIRFQPVQTIKMLSGNENQNLLRIQTSVQKPQHTIQPQITVETNVNQNQTVSQLQSSPNQQTVTQPQNSPKQVL